jgi:hypothetical protein
MTDQRLRAYVDKADLKVINVHVLDSSIINDLKSLGFAAANSSVEFAVSVFDDMAKAAIFARLLQLGVAFSAGREWCPAEVFEYLRDLRLLSGKYPRIAWTSPSEYRVTWE